MKSNVTCPDIAGHCEFDHIDLSICMCTIQNGRQSKVTLICRRFHRSKKGNISKMGFGVENSDNAG